MSSLRWQSGADWLSVSFPRETMQKQWAGLTRKASEVAQEVAPGRDAAWQRWYGYDGWQRGPVFCGERPDSYFLRASGGAAEKLAWCLPDGNYSISRLDLMVTVWLGEESTMVAKAAHEAARASREVRKAPARMKIRLEDGTGDGDTLYLGSRSSDAFGRVYDKHKESGKDEYAGAWRWEIQFKNRKADYVHSQLRHEGQNAHMVAATVRDWYGKRGVRVPCYSVLAPSADTATHRDMPDVERQLMWLEKQVRPCVRKLLREVDKDRILEVLGLTDGLSRG